MVRLSRCGGCQWRVWRSRVVGRAAISGGARGVGRRRSVRWPSGTGYHGRRCTPGKASTRRAGSRRCARRHADPGPARPGWRPPWRRWCVRCGEPIHGGVHGGSRSNSHSRVKGAHGLLSWTTTYQSPITNRMNRQTLGGPSTRIDLMRSRALVAEGVSPPAGDRRPKLDDASDGGPQLGRESLDRPMFLVIPG